MPKEKNTKNKNKEGEQTPQENSVQNEGVPSIAMSIEEYDALQTQLADLKSQSEEYLNGLQRERADFANYKRRIDQESLNTYQNALADIVRCFYQFQMTWIVPWLIDPVMKFVNLGWMALN